MLDHRVGSLTGLLLPLLTAALMLMLGEKRRPFKAKINLFSSVLGLGIAILLLFRFTTQPKRCPT